MTNTKEAIFTKIDKLKEQISLVAQEKKISSLFLYSKDARSHFTQQERQELYNIINNFRDSICNDKNIQILAKKEFKPEYVNISLNELTAWALRIALNNSRWF